MTEPFRNRITGSGMEAPEQLLANPRNWRVHPKAQEAALAAVLDEVGWVQNVIVNQRTGNVVDGHLRVSLAISRGEATVPVVYVDLDENEEGLVLATIDPLSAMAGTDKDLLAQLLGDVVTTNEELQAMLDATATGAGLSMKTEGLTDPDEVPESVPTRSKRGDLWLLGEHRVLCGDATSAEDVGRVLDGAVPNLMVTDPPYGVEYDQSWREEYTEKRNGPSNYKHGKVTNDDRADWTDALVRHPGEVAYVWCASLHSHEVATQIVASGFELRTQIIWVKQLAAFSRGHYHWRHEPCWYAVRVGGTASWIGDRKQNSAWEIANLHPNGGGAEAGEQTEHSTQKPIEVMARPIRNHKGDVYDPFLGSGTTLIACEQLGRKCYGLEIEPKYVDVILQRWENFTGKTAVLE